MMLFDRYELLDVCGPLDVFGALPEHFTLELVGPVAGPVRSTQGPRLVADVGYADASPPDLALVPGGFGIRALVDDAEVLAWLARWAGEAPLVASVCTGAGLLAAAGLLDGRRATSNKRAFAWAAALGPAVTWVPVARWVTDGDRWTSAGVAAGMDMALAMVGHLLGEQTAEEVATRLELERHRDPGWDPFAAANGLV